MTPQEIYELLTYCQIHDRRTVGRLEVVAWQEALPKSLTFPIAKEAARLFYAQPSEGDRDAFLTTRHLLRFAKIAKANYETAQARERAMRPAIKAPRSAYLPPADFRQRVLEATVGAESPGSPPKDWKAAEGAHTAFKPSRVEQAKSAHISTAMKNFGRMPNETTEQQGPQDRTGTDEHP